LYGLGEGDQRTRRFYLVSTVMGNDEKCLLLRVGFRFSAVDLPAQKFCAGSKRKVPNAISQSGVARPIPLPLYAWMVRSYNRGR
jgi:hypothetical protein